MEHHSRPTCQRASSSARTTSHTFVLRRVSSQANIDFYPIVGPHDRRTRGLTNEGLVWNHALPEDFRQELRTKPMVLEIMRRASGGVTTLGQTANKNRGSMSGRSSSVDIEQNFRRLNEEVFGPMHEEASRYSSFEDVLSVWNNLTRSRKL
jgi:hypothetical protein